MTECPHCQASVEDGALECAHCGVIFARWHGQPDAPAGPVAKPSAALPDPLRGPLRIARIVGLIVLVLWTVQFARLGVNEEVADSILHLPDLVFHEAGHVLFGFFGRFMTVLGGSLFQFLVPVILAVSFLRQRNQYAAAVCTWWAGQNLVDVAPYIADARALQLILLGGHTGAEVEGHDWEFLLTQLGWLHLDRTLGLAAFRIGLGLMIGAIVWGAVYVARARGSATLMLPDDEPA